jgi:hypothetical protein
MSPSISKSRNLDFYPLFFRYDDPGDIDFNALGRRHGVEPNRLRGMMRSARHNATIYQEMKRRGYGDRQIPSWFARPETVVRRGAPAGRTVSAEKRSSALTSAGPASRPDTPHIEGIVQGETAERPSALSQRSAPPTPNNWFIQPVEPPMSQTLKKAYQLFDETIQQELMERLEQRKRSLSPPRTPIPQELKVKLEAYNMMMQLEARNAFWMMHMMNVFQPKRRNVPLEVKEAFKISQEEITRRQTQKTNSKLETIEAIGRFYEGLLPKSYFLDEISQELKEVISEVQKREREEKEREREEFLELEKVTAENKRKAQERRKAYLEPFKERIPKFPWE